MSGRWSRTKGASYEREVAKEMQVKWPRATRGDQRKRAPHKDADIENTPYHVECKKGKKPNWRAAWKQALQDKEENMDERPAIVITRDDRGVSFVHLPLSLWLENHV